MTKIPTCAKASAGKQDTNPKQNPNINNQLPNFGSLLFAYW
jgi:hypothetical protein